VEFKQDGRAHIIDWDLSGRDGVRVYPNGFCHDIGWDGKRHPSALERNEVQKEHDKYSLVAILRMITCQDEVLETAYRRLLPTIDDALKLVDACNEIDMVQLLDSLVALRTEHGDDARVSIEDWEERHLSEFTAQKNAPLKKRNQDEENMHVVY
jgi:hypothetical protein